MAATYTLISSQVLGTISGVVTFSSIPQTFQDLVVKVSAACSDASGSTADFVAINFNGGSSSVWSDTGFRTNGASLTSFRDAANTYSGITTLYCNGGSGNTANTFSNSEFYIPNYTSSAAKQVFAWGTDQNNVSSANYAFITTESIFYNNATAITSITIANSSSGGSTHYNVGSSFYLYGIKNS